MQISKVSYLKVRNLGNYEKVEALTEVSLMEGDCGDKAMEIAMGLVAQTLMGKAPTVAKVTVKAPKEEVKKETKPKKEKAPKKEVVVVEWEPHKVELAKEMGCKIIYGNTGDPDIWEETYLKKANLLVSTIGENRDDDLNLGKWIRKKHPRIISIAETNKPEEVKLFKKAGYDYVLYQDEAEWTTLKAYLDSPRIKKRVLEK